MARTPRIPKWIKSFQADGFTNIWELIPDEESLYGTETLYGDWDGELLILLQDFCHDSEIRGRIDRAEQQPYRHDARSKTNTKLQQYVAPFVSSVDPRRCGALYGSAMVGLLKHGKNKSAALKQTSEVKQYATDVLRWTVEKMTTCKAIACCGKVAWNTAVRAFHCSAINWRHQVDLGRPISVLEGRLKLFAMRHPVNREPDAHQLSLRAW